MEHPSNTTGDDLIDVRERNRTSTRVVLALIIASVIIGVVAFWRYRMSETALTQARLDIARKGAALTPEQCVETVVEWARRCEAMKTLCDASMPRMTKVCLEAADRAEYCARVGHDAMAASSFGYDDCERLGGDRNAMKACALSYRAIANHCENLAAGREVP